MPDPALLPLEAVLHAAERSWRAYAPASLEYGFERGPLPLRHWLATRFCKQDRVTVDPDDILLTAGATHALQLVADTLAREGSVVLVESPTYNLAVALFRERHLSVAAVECDAEGLLPDRFEREVARLRAEGAEVAFLYLQPTFQNPTGSTMSPARKVQTLAVAEACGVRVVEDEAYRELGFSDELRPSLWAHAGPPTLRVGSFSKTMAPGLRLGWIAGPRAVIDRLSSSALFLSGGGIAHMAALAIGDLCERGCFDRHLSEIRIAYAARASALLSGVRSTYPELPDVDARGGFFAWMPLPAPTPRRRVLQVLSSYGVAAHPGSTFVAGSTDSRETHLRAAWSNRSGEELALAGRRLGRVLRELLG
jgi:2-aminoadipate transaminase